MISVSRSGIYIGFMLEVVIFKWRFRFLGYPQQYQHANDTDDGRNPAVPIVRNIP